MQCFPAFSALLVYWFTGNFFASVGVTVGPVYGRKLREDFHGIAGRVQYSNTPREAN